MKRRVLESFALASLAASPVGGAHAALTSPTFSCLDGSNPSAGGTVSWPFSSAVPELTLDFLSDPDVSSKLDCSGGLFSETVLGRKSGEGQKDFLKVTMKEVFVAGFAPDGNNHLKMTFTQVLGAIVNGVQTYEAYWDIAGDYLLANFDGGVTPSTNFIGFKLQTTQKFGGLSSLKYEYGQNLLTFSAELQEQPGLLSLTRTPRAVDEPGALTLLGTGLLGAAALRRRRRGW